ncbi:hypothetical protein NQ534_10055 [Marvinbryantia formatexigens DSM 14469]|nr:hypothetical protein [Marvinbryantia formatexigens]UWO26756.1 hypothetical protein NQ534_10055 [Marvinbryantia formatexigens DSM 14469]SDG86615.1 hypothetical protein SAMN05660368_03413 [Marvinbryantia formatexigens]
MNDKSTMKRIEKIFPDYFQRFKLPDGAREESIMVYRACRSGKCDKNSFLPSFEESGYVLNPMADSADPGQYSLSTFEKPTDVKRFAGVISDMKVPYQIAIGETNPRHGLVQRTKERTKKRTSHVDWWLYKDASPYEEFEMIDNFEEHLQNYIKKRDEKK